MNETYRLPAPDDPPSPGCAIYLAFFVICVVFAIVYGFVLIFKNLPV